ncbi:SLAP domain-containing protein [Niallia taxi]|uniref:SLAP domain-containing protein n=1 Tax=Niallia taxi TaxID=2499688 RepID=UPI0015F40AA9|nr:SLAP domain-containing protein [Niallia taxi]
MKYLRYGILILLVFSILSGCGNNDENKEETKQEETKKQSLTVAPGQEKPDEKRMDELQTKLNELGDAPESRVSFTGVDAKFQDDGSLVIEGFVRNGFDYTIKNLAGELKVLDNRDNEPIASEPFTLSEDKFGKLKSGESRLWAFTLKAESVKNKENDLKNYVVIFDGLTMDQE